MAHFNLLRQSAWPTSSLRFFLDFWQTFFKLSLIGHWQASADQLIAQTLFGDEENEQTSLCLCRWRVLQVAEAIDTCACRSANTFPNDG